MTGFSTQDLLTDVDMSESGDLIVSIIGQEKDISALISGVSSFSDRIFISTWTYKDIELALKERPDIILYICRIADAFEDFEKIRALRERLEHIPILGLSTHNDADYKIEFLRNGVTAFWDNTESAEGLYFQLRALSHLGTSSRLLEVENRQLKSQLNHMKV